MLPILGNQHHHQSPPPPDIVVVSDHYSTPKKRSNTKLLLDFKTKSYVALRLCSWLFLTICFQFLLVVFLSRSSDSQSPSSSSSAPPSSASLSFQDHHDHQQLKPRIPSTSSAPAEECRSGKVFVYDLPPVFNKELIENCNDLDPWSSRCNAVSNGGFGPRASGLDGIVPSNLTPAWYWTDMYAAEVIYHNRMLGYKCRTLNPDSATAYYIPFYVGLAVGKYLWFNYTSRDRDRHGKMLLEWVKDQPQWKQSNGSDHFIMFGRLTWDFRRLSDSDEEWGTSFIYMPLMKNVLKLTVERSPWDPLEVSVPYPTAFHPRSQSDVSQWQSFVRSRQRSSLFCFVGATRKKIKNDFRGVLMDYCKKEEKQGWCKVVDCAVAHCYDGAPAILEAFLDSDFCLQPKGDGFTRRSFYDCMLAGSIPVYFWEGSFKGQYEWHLPGDSATHSVFIDHNQVRNGTTGIIKTVLQSYSKEEIKKMRERVIDLMPRFLYARSSGGDAFDTAVEEVLQRFKKQRRRREQSKHIILDN